MSESLESTESKVKNTSAGGVLMSNIHEAMTAIMTEIAPIEKDKQTEGYGPKYSFRSVYGVYQAVQPLMAKHGVFMRTVSCDQIAREHGQTKSGTITTTVVLKIKYAFVAEDGSEVTTEVIAEAMDTSDKAYNKALSIGHKYAIVQAFCIPDEDLKKDDPENEHLQNQRQPPPQKNKQQPPPQQPKDGPISEVQRRRLFGLTNGKWTHPEIKALLKHGFQIDSTKDIPQSRYEHILKVMEEASYGQWAQKYGWPAPEVTEDIS